jgi:hypothetical protein
MTHVALASLLGAALLIAATVLHAFGLYAVTLLLLGTLRGSRAIARTGTSSQARVPRLAALVVAHDEERVVANSVRSLLAQRYAKDHLSVFVVADRCTDRTAAVARDAGAVVLERPEGGAQGKSAAVAWGIEQVSRSSSDHDAAEYPAGWATHFDAVAVFDADNHVDPDFASSVTGRLADGERVVQGFVDSTNAAASWVSGSSALGFWSIARVAQEPRERLGLSTPLMGTGFAMNLADARTFLCGAASLTDDLDLGARLALADIRVAYDSRARTVDEKPVELGTAVAQRHRWMQGRWAVAGQNVPRLLARAFGPSSAGLGSRLRNFDAAVQLIAPSLLFTGVALAGVATVVAILAGCEGGAATAIATKIPLTVSWWAAAVYYLLPGLLIAKFRPPPRVWLCYLVQPAYLALSVPLAASGWLFRNDRRWQRTPKGL